MSEMNEKLNLKQIAATMMVALGVDRAAKIYKHLKDDEIKSLTFEVANLESSNEQRDEILANFISYIFSAE